MEIKLGRGGVKKAASSGPGEGFECHKESSTGVAPCLPSKVIFQLSPHPSDDREPATRPASHVCSRGISSP